LFKKKNIPLDTHTSNSAAETEEVYQAIDFFTPDSADDEQLMLTPKSTGAAPAQV
jgi:hypothetical protein